MAKSLPQLTNLTGLRALLLFWVCVFHSYGCFFLFAGHMMTPGQLTSPSLPLLIRHGFWGVDCFFILSGLVMAYNYWHKFKGPLEHRCLKQRTFYFWGLRIARVYPGLLAAFLIGSVCVFAHIVVSPVAPLANVWNFLSSLVGVATLTYALTDSTFIGTITHFWYVNPPLFSVNFECFCYLLFPIIAVMLSRCKLATMVLLALLGLVVLQVIIWFDSPTILGQQAPTLLFFSFGYRAFVRVLVEFVFGITLYLLIDRYSKKFTPRSTNCWMVVVLIALLASLYTRAEGVTLLLSGCLLFLLSQPSRVLLFLFSNKVLIYLGDISYSIYLFHFLVLQIILKAIDHWHMHGLVRHSVWWQIVFFGLFFVFSIISAVLSYHFIESPCRRRLRAITKRRFAE